MLTDLNHQLIAFKASLEDQDNLLVRDVWDRSLLGIESPDVVTKWLIHVLLDFGEVEVAARLFTRSLKDSNDFFS